jgi:signal transduction histidine kinase
VSAKGPRSDALDATVEQRTAQLRVLAREVTLAEERQRRAIARDLHDHLGQALAFIRMQLSALQGDVMFSGVESRLETISNLLDKSIRYTRTLTAEISPPVLYELGLRAAVEWLSDEMRRKYDLPVRVKAWGDLDVTDEATRVMLFVAVRELLINVVKHAEARKVRVELHGSDAAVGLVVRDDGQGFDPAATTEPDGFGLFSVAERIQSMGGTVEIASTPGRGTTITLSVPREATE